MYSDFNVHAWPQGTVVTLCSVPWDAQYDKVVIFNNKQERDNYINSDSGKIVVDKVRYIRHGEPLVLEIPFSKAQKFNYVRVENPSQPVNGDEPTVFYYFVVRAEHRAPSSTVFYLQHDVWQHLIYDVLITGGYLERGHAAMKNFRDFGYLDPFGANWLDGVEPIDTGTDYIPSQFIGAYTSPISDRNGFGYLITSSVSLTAEPQKNGKPHQESSKGSTVGYKETSTETYYIHDGQLKAYMEAMSGYPYITSGISRVVAIPALPNSAIENVPRVNSYPPGNLSGSYLNIVKPSANTLPSSEWDLRKDIKTTLDNLVPDYSWIDKLHTHPFSMGVLFTNTGSQLFIDSKHIQNEKLELRYFGSWLPYNETIMCKPYAYTMSNPQNLDFSIRLNNFPVLPVVNNAALAALQSQHNSITNARESAAWGRDRSMAGIANAFNNSTIGMENSINQGRIARNADIEQTALNNSLAQNKMGINAINSIVGSAGTGGAIGGAPGAGLGAVAGAGGAIASVAGTALDVQHSNASLSLRNSSAVESQNSNIGAETMIRDNNYALAEYGAAGDYANAIAGIDAKIQDTLMTPPSISGSYGGEVATWDFGYLGIYGQVKTITRAALYRVGAYLARYGYSANKFTRVSDLKLMSHCTYWKMHDTTMNVSGGANEDYINTIRGIFSKGVSIFNHPDLIKSFYVSDNKPEGW